MATLVQGYMKVQVKVGSPLAYADIAGVTNVSGGGFSPNRIDATDFDTTAGTKEYLSGPRDAGPFTFDMHFESGDVEQDALFTAEAANSAALFRIKFSTVDQVTFSAVPSLVLAAPVDGKITYSVSLEPLEAPVRAAYSA